MPPLILLECLSKRLRFQERGPPLIVRPDDVLIAEYDLLPPGTVANATLLKVMSWIPGMEMLQFQAMVVRLVLTHLLIFPSFLMHGCARLRVEFVHVPIFLR